MLFGSSYYPEYQPCERLDEDLALMREARFSVLRVGESTWSSYEPRAAEIGFGDLLRVVDHAHANGIKAIVGTPTYAIPAWLARTHPEVMARTPERGTLPFGARQNVDFTAPAFRFYARRIVEAMADTFGHHPGVIGFQIDNEIGKYHLANEQVLESFRSHLLRRFGDVETINRKWGLTFWSHRLADIGELWPPEGNTNPGYALEWERFQASLCTEFLRWQESILRPRIAPDKFVTHALAGGSGARSADMRAIAETVDRAAVTMYFPMQSALERPGRDTLAPRSGGFEWSDMDGAWGAFWRSDLAYGAKGPRGSQFLVIETGGSPIGFSHQNEPPYPGQLRLAAHAYVSRGAQMIAYWHWHTLHFGMEAYWGGVLGHDLEPNRTYREAAQIGAELAALDRVAAKLTPHADVAILYSRDSAKALEVAPCFALESGSAGDPRSYLRVFNALYRAAFDERLQVRIVHADSDWSGEKVLLVPALYIADETLLDRIVARAEAGGHVVTTFRTGVADEDANVRHERQPGRLRDAVGASYQEYATLRSPVRLTTGRAPAAGAAASLALPAGSVGTGWADLLQPEGADVLWGYDDPFLGPYAAVTTRQCGKGRITWLGTLPDRNGLAALVGWAAGERNVSPATRAWPDLPESVQVSSARTEAGGRLWFVANYGWEPARVAAPQRCRTLVAPNAEQRGDTLALGPWDCCVLQADGEP